MADDARVSTLELFFDLVFVFTITQLTIVLVDAPTARSVARIVLTLTVIWWMYGGYAWLTNHVSMEGPRRRVALLAGMAAFFVTALAIPDAFGDAGVWFGVAYLVVNVIHVVLFQQASGAAPAAMLGVFKFNLSAALLVLAGGIAGGTAQDVLWIAAIVLTWGVSRVAIRAAFEIAPAHFVERHGLVVLVALGESVVAVGAGVNAHALDAGLVAVALLGLALSALLWWAYFGGDDDRAEAAMTAETDIHRRALMALDGFGICFIPLLLGIVLIAAGERATIAHAFHELDTAPALFLASGVAVFLGAEAAFRRILDIAPSGPRVVTAVACLATIPLGLEVAAAAQLAALVALVAAAFAIEGRATRARRPARTPRPASPPAPPR
jgi:low temperature requirement protein LtrA